MVSVHFATTLSRSVLPRIGQEHACMHACLRDYPINLRTSMEEQNPETDLSPLWLLTHPQVAVTCLSACLEEVMHDLAERVAQAQVLGTCCTRNGDECRPAHVRVNMRAPSHDSHGKLRVQHAHTHTRAGKHACALTDAHPWRRMETSGSTVAAQQRACHEACCERSLGRIRAPLVSHVCPWLKTCARTSDPRRQIAIVTKIVPNAAKRSCKMKRGVGHRTGLAANMASNV